MKWIRRTLIFVVALGVGLFGLWLLTRSKELPARRGFRVEEVEPDPAERVPLTFIPPGLPRLLGSDNLGMTRFERIDFQEARGEVFEVLAWHLTVDGLDMVHQRALGPVFTLYPRPESPEQAREFAKSPPEQVVVLRAGQATILRHLMPAPTGGGVQEEQWELNLERDVNVSSRQEGREIVLVADDLKCLSTDRRISSKGDLKITADAYSITGKGLAGDAELGTFSVTENVDVTLPTAALLGEGKAAVGTVTRITSKGPLLVERLGSPDDDDGPMPTRVRFLDGTTVLQEGADGAPPDTLNSRELVLLLLVESRGKGADAKVEVEEVRADGEVILTRGSVSRITAAALHLKRTAGGQRVEVEGPLSIRHQGVLPGATGGFGKEEATVTIVARDSATITSGSREEPVHTTFHGRVVANREAENGGKLITLSADSLAVTSDPVLGETMVATGHAAFSSPTASGQAERIEWRRDTEGREEITLTGAPRVQVVGGGSFNPFGAPGEKSADADPGTLVLRSSGPMTLNSMNERRELTLADQVHVAKVVDGKEVLYLEADRVGGTFAGEVLELLTADGGVAASGQGEAKDGGSYFASGDRIEYSQVTGLAVLTGSPASVRMLESGDQVNQIQAARLTFLTEKDLFVAEEEVTAVVYLAEAGDGGTRPFTLSCTRLSVVPGRTGEGRSLKGGRLSSLTAAGPVVLRGRARAATGDRLVYTGEDARRIELTGKPARVTQEIEIDGRTYEDFYESDLFTLTLAERDIDRAEAPGRGNFALHRAFGEGSPTILGNAGGKGAGKAGRVERFLGSCTGSSSYDTKVARLLGNARIEQFSGAGDTFTKVAEFGAEKIEAWRGLSPEGRPEIVRARGERMVRGSGGNWQVSCDSFEVDLKTHRTTMKGSPAEVTIKGRRQSVSEAVYDYESDHWVEMIRPRRN